MRSSLHIPTSIGLLNVRQITTRPPCNTSFNVRRQWLISREKKSDEKKRGTSFPMREDETRDKKSMIESTKETISQGRMSGRKSIHFIHETKGEKEKESDDLLKNLACSYVP
ncbi:hypothetical protein CAJAP_07188 [Camponotus japonicus]